MRFIHGLVLLALSAVMAWGSDCQITINPITGLFDCKTAAGASTGVNNPGANGILLCTGTNCSTSSAGNLTGDVTSSGLATTVVKINGVTMSGLGTGIVKNTTGTGVPSIAVAGDFPTLNQNTTGTAASFTGSLVGDVTGTQGATVVGKVNGVAYSASPSVHQIAVITASNTATYKTVNDCQGTGKALTFIEAGDTFGCNTISGSGGAIVTNTQTGTTNTVTHNYNAAEVTWSCRDNSNAPIFPSGLTFNLNTTVFTFSTSVTTTCSVVGGTGGGGGGSGTVNSGTANYLAYYASTGTAVSGLATGNNGVLVTNGSGVPSISTTLPTGIVLGTVAAGSVLTNATGLVLTAGAGVTGVLPNANTTAASANTVSAIVARDSSGDFAMRDLTARNGIFSGAVTTGGVTNTCTGGLAGCLELTQGTAMTALPANGIQIIAPSTVTTSYGVTLPGAGPSATNVMLFGALSSARTTASFGKVTSSYVDTSIAQTGVDINTSHQVTATHLASALPVNQGGTGAATLTGPLKGNGTSAIGAAAAADIYGLWSGTCSSSTYLRGDGSCNTPGGSGTVTVVGAGSLTSTAIMTGGGTTAAQTPSATSTLDSSGTMVLAGTLRATSVSTGTSPPTPPAGGTGGAEVFGEGTAPTSGCQTAGVSCLYSDSNAHAIKASFNDTPSQLARYADKLSVFAATTSAELAGVLSDEQGSGGGFVRATSPTVTTPTFSGDTTFSSAPIIISGNISAAAWTTNGVRIKGTPGTLTDTSSSGTVATAYTDVLGGNTIAASSSTTFTNYYTMYAKDPAAGSNVTLTNKWALGGDSLKVGTTNPVTISTAGVLTLTGAAVLGTPASATLTNATGLPVSTGISGLGIGVATFLATPSGENFNSMIAAGGVPIAQSSKSAAYTTVLADGGTQILHPTADNNARTFTIDSNANVAYPIGTTITFINQINTLTIAITSDTLQLAGTATTGSRTIAAGGMGTAIKVTSTLWYISGPGVS